MSFWSDFFQRELIIRVASMDLMDLLVVFFAIPTSFQNYPKGYLLRKRVAIIILSLSKRLLSTLPSRTYMSPHVLAPCQELFPNPISLISPSPSFSAHHFQIDRSYIVKKCWFPSWFSQLHDVPWCPMTKQPRLAAHPARWMHDGHHGRLWCWQKHSSGPILGEFNGKKWIKMVVSC